MEIRKENILLFQLIENRCVLFEKRKCGLYCFVFIFLDMSTAVCIHDFHNIFNNYFFLGTRPPRRSKSGFFETQLGNYRDSSKIKILTLMKMLPKKLKNPNKKSERYE